MKNIEKTENEPIDDENNGLDAIVHLEPIHTDPQFEAFFKQSELLTDMQHEISDIRKRLDDMDLRMKAFAKQVRPVKRDALYLVIFGIATLVTVLLVAHGWAEKPTVSIEFNIGEVIGGLLVGVAAVLAGVSYARGRSGD